MKWTSVIGSGVLAAIMAFQVSAAEEGASVMQQMHAEQAQAQARTMTMTREQAQTREQVREKEGAGSMNRYQHQNQHRSRNGTMGGGARR